jgi:pyruvate/2-oxoglutarate dehydrogenase complex dihydrolipoamide acyltransferase (E2) component
MATEVILPMLGETMNEGTIVAWSKKEGDAIKPGDVLYSVESDKATLEVESTAGGYLQRILAPAGSTVAVLSVVAYITATRDEVSPAPAGEVAAAPARRAASSKTSAGWFRARSKYGTSTRRTLSPARVPCARSWRAGPDTLPAAARAALRKATRRRTLRRG